MMGTTYDADIIAWASEQAALLRSGQLSALDIENIAEEILDVGKSEQREFASRMVILLVHLLKWHYQPERRGASWKATIQTQRRSIERRLRKTPSLKASLSDADWLADAWDDAMTEASQETGIGLDVFEQECPWAMQDILLSDWLPS